MTTDVSDDRPAFMLDTNVFNRLAKKPEKDALDMAGLAVLCSLESHEHARWLATRIQLYELQQTPKEWERSQLVATFYYARPEISLASSFTLDVEGAGFDQSLWNDGSQLVERMLNRLAELEPASKKKKRQKKLAQNETDLNPLRDILIAETAFKADATLVTGDEHLYQVAVEFGLRAIYAPPANKARQRK